MDVRRNEIQNLSGDPSAARVPRITLDPRRSARTLMADVQDHYPGMPDADALGVAFARVPPLREAFSQQGLSLADIPERHEMTLERPITEADATMKESMMQTDTNQPMTATEALLARAKEAQATDSTLSHADAMAIVAKRHPELYHQASREQTLDRDGLSLSHRDTNSAAADALNLKPRTTPGITPTTIKPQTPVSSLPMSETPSAAREIERLAQVEVSATRCTYPVAVRRVMTPRLARAWEEQGRLKVFDVDLDDLLRWGADDEG